MVKTVVGIGNTTGAEIDKFKAFKLTSFPASKVDAPLIKECHTNIECKLIDAHLLKNYNFFIFEAVKAHCAIIPKYPRTIHYRGDGIFMVSGRHVNYRSMFKKQNL